MSNQQVMNEEQFVSVVMPVYNSARFLREAMDSVLGQSYSQLELIAVYDDSEDDSLKILYEYKNRDKRVRVIENQGKRSVSTARNLGIHAARGWYIAFADSDDIWTKDKLKRQLNLIQKKGADMVYASYDFINQDGEGINRPYIVPDRTEFKEILTENVIGTSTVLLTAACLKEHEFRTDFYQEDYVLWLELLQQGNFVAMGDPTILVHYRVSEGARSSNRLRTIRSRWIVYREYLNYSVLKSLPLWIRYIICGIQKYAFVCAKHKAGGGTFNALNGEICVNRCGWLYRAGFSGVAL